MFYMLRVSMAESISTIKQRLQAKTDFQFGANLIKFLKNITLGISVFFLTMPCLLNAQVIGQLESPVSGSYQFGIDGFSGWACNNGQQVTASIDGGGSFVVAYGGSRTDTQSICGGIYNGFSGSLHWANVGEGEHHLCVYLGSVEIGCATVHVLSIGKDFVTGGSEKEVLVDIPEHGVNLVMQWDQSRQRPVVVDVIKVGASSAVGVFRNGTWFLDYNANGAWDGCQQDGGQDKCLFNSFGQAGDLPAAGNWDGGLKAGVGVFRNGTWYLDYNGNGAWDGCQQDGGQDQCLFNSFGQAGDLPAAGDWNGDGKAKVGVFRNGTWYLDYNGNGAWDGCGVDRCYFGSFGQAGDLPVAGKW